MATSQVIRELIEIAFIAGLTVMGCLYSLSIVWAFQDGRARGKSGVLVALIVAFLAWPLGLIVWVLMRPKGDKNTVRLKLSPRFSLSVLLLLVTIAAMASYYVSRTTYYAIALVRVRQSFGNPTDIGLQNVMRNNYARAKELVIQDLASELVVDKAIRRVTGRNDPKMVQAIRERLQVSNPGNSEIVQVTLRGHTFHHDSRDILNSIIECYIESAEDDRVQFIQTAAIP